MTKTIVTFETAFARLTVNEGGLSMRPEDPGNWTGGRVGIGKLHGTKFGLSAATYPDLDIAALTLDAAREIYRRDWWERLGAETMDGAVVFQVWDFAVNAGMGTARRALQRAVGVSDDGAIGAVTLAAIAARSTTDVLFRFTAQKLRYYTARSNWPTEGRGWTNRCAADLELAADDS